MGGGFICPQTERVIFLQQESRRTLQGFSLSKSVTVAQVLNLCVSLQLYDQFTFIHLKTLLLFSLCSSDTSKGWRIAVVTWLRTNSEDRRPVLRTTYFNWSFYFSNRETKLYWNYLPIHPGIPHSFSYYPQLMTIGEGRNIDWLVSSL